ncbi:MAG: hypothetical protein GXY03_02670 [Solirubrobacterales bacterium]|nr:hypothetical protein [Solirubrobacterales bacterium]
MSDERIAALLAGAAVPDATAAREATVVSALRALRGEGPGRRTGSGNDPKLGRTSTERPEGEAPARAGAAGSDPGREPAAPRHRWLPRLARRGWAIAALAVALLTVAAVSPPGRAALAGAADLIGKIGGAPASDGDAGLESTVPPGQPGSPTVVDTGEAPDGSRYEWIAYRREEPDGFDTFCTRFAWVGEPLRDATGGCGSPGAWSPGAVWLWGRRTKPPAGGGGGGDYMLIGGVKNRVGELRIIYRRPGGERVDLPVDLARVRGPLLRRAGGTRPFTLVTAFIPSAWVRADRLRERYMIRSLSLVNPAVPYPRLYHPRFRRCIARHGGLFRRGWIDVYAYDRAGRQIAALRSRTTRPPVPECEALKRLPQDRGVHRLTTPKAPPPEPPPPRPSTSD